MRWPNLTDVLSGVRWAVVGAVATRRYMPERATADLDVVVLAEDAARAAECLTAAGYGWRGDLAIGGSSWEAPDGAQVDVIEGREPWWPVALAEATANRDEQGLPVLTLPYLVLMKLLASRVQDLADVTRMLGAAADSDLARVREAVRQHAGELKEDLESLISLGKLETGDEAGE